MRKVILALTTIFFIVGCADKQQPINQTALFWHNYIFKHISTLQIDRADDDFTSLEVEHPNSQFIPIDLLNLSFAHSEDGEFELAQFYMNEYKNRYASKSEKEWADYTIAKFKFFSLKNSYTNQKQLNESLDFINKTISNYPDSIYNYELNTMKKKLELTKLLFRDRISKLYQKLDAPKSAEIYKTDINKSEITPPYIPWYKKIFYW